MKRTRSSLLTAFLLAAALPQEAQAASITVDGTNCTLADAITAANTDAAAGNCPAGSGADTITLQVDVTLAADLPQISSAITIEGGGHFISGNNARRVLYIANTGNLTLNATTVKNGNASMGGGIYNDGGIVIVDGSSYIGNNTAYDTGGGIYSINGGTVTVKNSSITNNAASAGGGGIYSSGGAVTVDKSIISGNAAGNTGAGLYINGGTLTLTDSAVAYNIESVNLGGGLAAVSAVVTVSRSTFNNNSAKNGAGLAVINGATATLNNSTISQNTATNLGGGILAYSSATFVTLNNTTVSQNTANAFWGGGGVSMGDNAAITVRSSIISGNDAGGFYNEVYNDGGTVTAASYNIFGHSGETRAQAFYNFTPVHGTGGDFVATSNGGGTPTVLSSIVSPLAANGGPTQTHALLAGSPAINLDAACSTGLTTDQRGYSRPINFKCDAGAVEYSPSFSTACGNGRDLPKDTWLMTAPSCQPADPADIASQYGDDLGGSYGSTWIAYKWDAAAQQYPPPMAAADPLILGSGNWLYSLNAATLDLSGTATPTEDCASCGWPGQQCFAIDLAIPPAGQSRWNLVGNPFPYAVNWADVRVSSSVNGSSWTLRTPSGADASVMRKTFHRWTGSAYEPKDDATPGSIGILQPQEAVWIKTLAADPSITNIKLLIPAR